MHCIVNQRFYWIEIKGNKGLFALQIVCEHFPMNLRLRVLRVVLPEEPKDVRGKLQRSEQSFEEFEVSLFSLWRVS
jgi:hypothetical protein